jgi:uncharacterized membrane protein YfcA
MKLRNLFLLNTIVALLFALGFLLMPGVLLDLFGFINNAGAKLLGRFIGVELLVGGLITFFARDSRDSHAQEAIILANLIASVVGFIASLAGVISGAMGVMGWLIVATYLLLSLAFGYFQLVGPRGRLFSTVRHRRI